MKYKVSLEFEVEADSPTEAARSMDHDLRDPSGEYTFEVVGPDGVPHYVDSGDLVELASISGRADWVSRGKQD